MAECIARRAAHCVGRGRRGARGRWSRAGVRRGAALGAQLRGLGRRRDAVRRGRPRRLGGDGLHRTGCLGLAAPRRTARLERARGLSGLFAFFQGLRVGRKVLGGASRVPTAALRENEHGKQQKVGAGLGGHTCWSFRHVPSARDRGPDAMRGPVQLALHRFCESEPRSPGDPAGTLPLPRPACQAAAVLSRSRGVARWPPFWSAPSDNGDALPRERAVRGPPG